MTTTHEPIIIEPIMQKDIGDCGVACLAMLLGLPYKSIYEIIPKRTRANLEGLSVLQLIRYARKLKFKLTYVKQTSAITLPDCVGILDLQRLRDPRKPRGKWEGHCVLWMKEVLYNPADGVIWTDLDSFLATQEHDTHRWNLIGVLVREK